MRLIVKLAGVCCAMVLSLGSGVAAAAPTDPDATFAGGGATTIPFAQGRSDARGLTLAPDGKIVAVGERLNMSNLQDWVVSRSLADGSPDISFNGNGRSQPVETSPVTGVFASGGQSVAVQGDGNIVVSGQTNGPIKVGRLHGDGTTDGQPDNTFGTAGLASITIPQSTRTEGRAIALQPDGKILVAGTAFVGGHQSVFLARFTSAGVPDVTFSASGAVFAPDAACDQLPEGVPTDCEAHSIALEPGSGSTPAAIYVGGGNVQGNVIGGRVFKFSPASGDTGWGIEAGYGTAGAAQIDRTAANEVYALLRQSDGRLVAVGDAQTGEPSFQCGATRLNPSGATDTTFGTNGIAKITLGKTCYPAGAALQADGRILITGTTTDGFNFAGTSNAALGRFTTGGQPDATFAPGGAAPVGVGGVASFGNAIVVQGGKPLIAGGSGSPQHVFALGRFAGGDLAGGGVTPTPTVTTTATATATATVTPAPGAPASPHVAGHPETGATLYCDPGSLTGDLSYAWFMVGGDGSASQIGTGSTLRVPSKAEGFFVECFVVQAGTSFGTASDNRVKIVERAVLPLFPSFTRALRNYLPGTKVCGNKGFCTDDEVRQDLEKLGTNLNWKTPDTVEHAHQVPKELRNDVAPGAVIDVGVSPGSAKQFSSGPGKPVTVKTTVFDPHIFSPNVCPFNVDLTSVGEQEFQLQDLLPGQSLSDARKLLRQLKCFRLNSEGDEIHSQYRVDLHTKKNVEQPIVTHAAIQRDDNAPGHRVYALDVDVPPADLVLDIQPTVGKTPTLGLADAALTAATKQATSFDVHVSTTVGIGAQHLAVDLRDREGALIDTQKTDPNGTAHFASVVDTPGLYELSTTLIDGDGDALAGYEPIRAVNRKGAQFTDLAGARWTAGGAGKPYSKAGARRAGAPLAHLSATEASNATLIQEQGKAMYAALFNSYCPQLPSGRYACEDNAFRAGLFGGTPEQVQFATQGMRLALETLLIIARDGVLTSDIHTRVSVVTIGGNGTLALATGQTVTVPTLQFDGKTVRTGLADGFVPGTGGLHIESDGFQVFPGGTWIVAQGGGNIISNDGGSLSAKTVDAAARRGFDIQAANIISDNGGGIARNGGSIISDNGGGLAVHGGNIISDHAAGILAQPGTQLIAAPGGAIVAQGGGNIISNDGGSR